MTQHLSAITLLVPNYDAGIAFDVGKLGFDLLEDTRLSETKRWVRVAPKAAQTGGRVSAATAALFGFI